MAIRQGGGLEVKRVKGKGRGVFARRAIQQGQIIESCPVLVMPIESVPDFSEGVGPYIFYWGKGTVALALGYGSLYNHSYEPNARYEDVGPRVKNFIAIRDIEEGEEITVNYNGDPADQTPMWFDTAEDVA